MPEIKPPSFARAAVQRPWDARLARWLVTPLKSTWVTPNHLTTVRLSVGLVAVAAFMPGTYLWSNVAALLLILSNFLDHTDGELARMSGKTSRFGHLYDLASDAVVTILLFVGIGVGVGARYGYGIGLMLPTPVIGAIVGGSIALIFYLRLQIEEIGGKAATRQASLGGFETEDILYLIPLVTLCNGLRPFLMVASICAPLYAIWVVIDYRRAVRQPQPMTNHPSSGVAR
jgi:archaetidylinositol phosphate synthase